MIFSHLKQRIADIQEDLGNSAGQEPLNDRFKTGAIGAYKDILYVSFEEASENA